MIKFGPSGTGELFSAEMGNVHTVDVAPWLSAKGLDCYEYSFGHGVRMSKPTANAIGKAFSDANVEISAHAPYYINLACEEERVNNNVAMIIETIDKTREMGGRRIVMHPGTQMKNSRADAMNKAKQRLALALDEIYAKGFSDMILAVESMGKLAQLGDADEVIELCRMDDMLYPCIDFGHQHSRTIGGINGKDDYRRLLDKYIDGLGYEKIRDMHAHFSKQMYSDKGEIKHVKFEDEGFGPDYAPLAELIAEYGLEPYFICESAGSQTLDAIEMKKLYLEKLNGQ